MQRNREAKQMRPYRKALNNKITRNFCKVCDNLIKKRQTDQIKSFESNKRGVKHVLV